MLNERAIENISLLEPFKRYQYFIKKVADFEEVWILVNQNNDIAFAEIESKILIPLWSGKEFASSCMEGVWNNYYPKKVDLKSFYTEVLPFVNEKDALLDVFPVKNRSGFVVAFEEFNRDLDEELENYE